MHGRMHQIKSSARYPNNPEYRKINGKVRMLIRTKITQVDYRMFFSQPISLIEDFRVFLVKREFLTYRWTVYQKNSLPEEQFNAINRLDSDVRAIPVVVTKDQLTLEIHYLP